MVILLDIAGNVDSGIRKIMVFLEINLLLFQATPSSFHVGCYRNSGLILAMLMRIPKLSVLLSFSVEGKLTTLILTEDLRRIVLSHGIFEELGTGFCL